MSLVSKLSNHVREGSKKAKEPSTPSRIDLKMNRFYYSSGPQQITQSFSMFSPIKGIASAVGIRPGSTI
jgi:hypothetical protein